MRRDGGWRDERGAVVAEFAIAVPAAIALVAAALAFADAGVRRAQAQDAASVLARVAARDEPLAPVAETLSGRVAGMTWSRRVEGSVQCVDVASRRGWVLGGLIAVEAGSCSLVPTAG